MALARGGGARARLAGPGDQFLQPLACRPALRDEQAEA
jgi:hypothetical protein